MRLEIGIAGSLDGTSRANMLATEVRGSVFMVLRLEA